MDKLWDVLFSFKKIKATSQAAWCTKQFYGISSEVVMKTVMSVKINYKN